MKYIYINDLLIHDFSDNDAGFVVDPDIKGLEGASIRLPSFLRPNVNGAFVPNQLYGGRLITFKGLVYANNVSDYQERRRALEAAVAISRDASGALMPLVLKMTTDDDLELQVNVYNKGFDFPHKDMMNDRYKLDLFAPEFYLVSQEELNINAFVFQGGGFTIPFEIPFSMGVAGSTVSSINNDGNSLAYPFYILRGPLTTPTFTNQTTGDSFALSSTLNAGEVVEIDTVRGTVVFRLTEDGDPVNHRQYFSGDFAPLARGENIVNLITASGSDTGLISIIYRHSYTGA